MSDILFHVLKGVVLIVQIGLPLLSAILFLLTAKTNKVRFIGVFVSFAVFLIFSLMFSRISWDEFQDYVNGDDIISGYAKRAQSHDAKLDPVREHDQLSTRAERISAQMYGIYNASHSAKDRAVLDQLDIDLAGVRWEYMYNQYPADQYAALLDDLEKLYTNRMPTHEEEVAWNTKFKTSGSVNMSAQFRKRYEAKVGPDFFNKLRAVPPIEDGILAFDRNVEALLLAHRFDDLEQMAQEFRQNDARFIGGHTKLASFYGALGAIQGEACGCGSYESEIPLETKEPAVKAWMAAQPQSITARIAMAQLSVTNAWKARGHGYAPTVNSDQWQLYASRMNEAEAYLDDLDPKTDPQIFWIRTNTTRVDADPRGEADNVYAEATQNFPHNDGFYSWRADILQQKWYGRPGELAHYTRSLLQNPGGNDGLIAYSFVAEELLQQVKKADMYDETGLSWPQVKQAFAAREKLYGLGEREWNVLLDLAALAGDRDSAADALNHIGENWDKGIWRDRFNFDLVIAWIYDR